LVWGGISQGLCPYASDRGGHQPLYGSDL